ncbi:hypothetical protein ASG41_10355 [Modestobacter sp. Leaf380]|nr:hypothetical protein ASG41_10355 [Modestobacter sp. Leaf380]
MVWAGSGTAWASVGWGEPVAEVLTSLGWHVSVVPWGDPAAEHQGRPGVLHVFTGGLEPVSSGTAAMADRLDAVRAGLAAADADRASVVGICLGAQMIAAVSGDVLPEAVPGGGEVGTTTLRGRGVPDVHVATAHVQQVPASYLRTPGVRLTWTDEVSTVQGFTVGPRVAGVQFHPELCVVEAGWAGAAFTDLLTVPAAVGARGPLDPARSLGSVLALAGAQRVVRTLAA